MEPRYDVWISCEDEPVATNVTAANASLLVRALNVFDNHVGAEFCAYHTPAGLREPATVELQTYPEQEAQSFPYLDVKPLEPAPSLNWPTLGVTPLDQWLGAMQADERDSDRKWFVMLRPHDEGGNLTRFRLHCKRMAQNLGVRLDEVDVRPVPLDGEMGYTLHITWRRGSTNPQDTTRHEARFAAPLGAKVTP